MDKRQPADNNKAYYYHFDGLGSVAALSNSNGDSCQSYEYSVYGQVAASEPNHTNPYMFTGRRFDIETGLYYYRARYYNPHIGRFMQTDPVGYADGINWYLYCSNNPVNFGDPSGKWMPTSGHFQMTNRCMILCGFSVADAETTASANRWVDINKFRKDNITPHYMAGGQASAEKLIRDEMFKAVKAAKTGDNKQALKHLGRVLHTAQDKHSHFAQDIKGSRDHFFSGKDPDNPSKHRDEWDDARRDTIQLINRLQRRTNNGATPNNNEKFER